MSFCHFQVKGVCIPYHESNGMWAGSTRPSRLLMFVESDMYASVTYDILLMIHTEVGL